MALQNPLGSAILGAFAEAITFLRTPIDRQRDHRKPEVASHCLHRMQLLLWERALFARDKGSCVGHEYRRSSLR